MKKESKQNLNSRLIVYQIFIFIFIALVIARLFIVSVSQHGYYKALASNQHLYTKKLTATRGDILISDQFSEAPFPVATNDNKDMVYAIPKDVINPTVESQTLAAILHTDQPSLLDKISNLQKNYIALAHNLTDDQSGQVNNAKLPGIYLNPEFTRVYPDGDFLSQVIGFVGYNNAGDKKIGRYGLEKYFDKDLAGTDGTISTETDFKGNWITGSPRDFTPAQDGSSLLLTINKAIQYQVENVLKSAVQAHGADSATAIVADPKTGAILAMANYPSFDPSQYGQVSDPSVFINSATMENYEPGSTMKSVTMAAGIDLGAITPGTTYTDTGSVKIAGYTIKNAEGNGYGVQTMTQVLDRSLNTGAIFAEQQIGNDNFLKYVKKFGFGQATNIELPENVGNINNLKSNSQINFYTAAFGQGITVTPMQMVQAYTALANDGKMMQPYIVDSEINADGTITKTQPKVIAQVISSKTAQLVSAMLVDDVENGFGKKAAVKGYFIGGKTGTAQVVANGKYVANDNIGSFIGYGPIENPKFLILVNVNHPRDVAFAETTAAPAFHEIAQFILNYYQTPPTRQ